MRYFTQFVAKCKRSATTIKTTAVLGAITLSATASAGSSTGATITHIYFGNSYGSFVFIEVSAAKTGNPSCSSNTTWGFVLPLTTTLENQMLAVVLAARTTNAPVTLTGSGLCDTYSNVETLENINY